MKIVNYQQKVLIRILIECLKVEDSPCLGFFEDVGLEVWLMFFFDILAVHDVNSTFKQSSFNTHSAELLNESRLSNSITA